MTSVQPPSASSTPQNPINTTSQPGAVSPAVVGSPSPNSSARSYAHATKSSISGPLVVGSASGSTSQHGKRESVGGRIPSNMAAPAIVNSSAANGGPGPTEHSRKPSVTISASGSTGQMPNGAPQTPSGARPNIKFGSMNENGSPAIANSTPYQAQPQSQSQPQQSAQSSSLPAPASDPRITSPTHSPTPIPPPTASGGRPPSGLASQNNGLNFGSLGAGPGPETSQPQHVPSGPQSNMVPPQNSHYRRASTQSHGDFAQGMPMGGGRGGGYMGNRGRGGYHQGYQHVSQSPGPSYRPVQPYQQRPGPGGVPPHFQNHGPPPGSPHAPPRSPAPMGSQPGTPHSQPIQMQQGYPTYGGYAQQLPGGPGQYAMQPNYDPQYNYYQQPYAMHPGYIPGGPQSPRNPGFRPQGPPGHQQQPYGPGQYPQPPSHNMSRSSSQVSERPASSLGSAQQPPQSSTPSNHTQISHGHSQSTSAASNPNFKIPNRASKGITIKNADGEVVTFDTKKTSPAPTPHSPAPSNNPTPPPRTASSTSHTHTRSDSVSGKSAAQIQAEFKEQVKREQEREPGIQEEEAPGAKEDKPEAETQEPAIVTSSQAPTAPSLGKEEDAPQAPANDSVVDVPAPREGSKAQEAVTEKQDADVKAPSADAEKPSGESKEEETPEERKKREDDEEFERMVAEMEAKEREEEEREKAFQEKKKQEAEAKAAKDKEDKATADERMKQAEREAEALEEAREAERAKAQEKTAEDKTEDKTEDEKMFASLKKPSLGPGAEAETPSTTPSTPQPDEGRDTMPPPGARAPAPASFPKQQQQRPKPAALKLETAKAVEPAQPTPGMRSLRSARMLQLQQEAVSYPDGVASPNPALNQSGRRGGRIYDKDFLMQFQDAFKEKPLMDWDQKLKDTVGDPSDSAVPKSARTPGPRNSSNPHRPGPDATLAMGKMGSFFGGSTGRTLAPGTTSDGRFNISNQQQGRPQNMNSLSQRFGSQPGFPMGSGVVPGAGRPPSIGNIPVHAQHRDNRSKQGSKGPKQPSAKEQADANKKMPLTAGSDLKPLEASGSGWKPPSVGRPGLAAATVDASGLMAPDMVQRKVKSNLNKMTPERFDKIAAEILKIAAQSVHETDGRTLRQVIALLFEKACDEAHWASMYAKFASRMLTEMSSEIKDENIKDRSGNPVIGGNLFRKYLLNRCQEEFERGWEVNLPLNDEGQQGEAAMLSDEYYKAAAAKRKGLGLVQFIGELYKLGMLSAKIMHTCVKKLLDFEGEPDEASIEGLSKLLRTVGFKLEDDAGTQMMNAYFARIEQIMNHKGLPSRMYFMLLDVVDLRKHSWRSKDDAKGPKTITQIREEAVQDQQQKAEIERQRQSQRGGGNRMPSGRGDARNFSGQMPPPDYNRNTLGTDELRKLSARKEARQASGAPGKGLGPSMLGSRSNSSRGLGPPAALMSRTTSSGGSSPGPASGLHSRSTSMAKLERKDEEPKTNVNAFRYVSSPNAESREIESNNIFSALAGMESEGADQTPSSSPPVAKSQPAGSNNSSSKPEDGKTGGS